LDLSGPTSKGRGGIGRVVDTGQEGKKKGEGMGKGRRGKWREEESGKEWEGRWERKEELPTSIL